MRYREIPPDPGQGRHIESLWQFESGELGEDAPKHVIVPDGAVSITMLRLPAGQVFVGLTGPSVTAYSVDLMPEAIYGGVRLRPGVAGSVLGCAADAFRDLSGPAATLPPRLLGRVQRALPAQVTRGDFLALVGRVATAAIEQSGPLDEAVCRHADRIREAGGDVALGALTGQSGISARQMRRRFRHQCGLSPKEFARLRRIRRACINLLAQRRPQLADAASGSGFADQAHMTRDFTRIFGHSTALVTAYLRQIEHNPEMLVAS